MADLCGKRTDRGPCQQPVGHEGLCTTCSCSWKWHRDPGGPYQLIDKRDPACSRHGKGVPGG